MASQVDEAFAGYQASGPVPQDEGKRLVFRYGDGKLYRAGAAVVRPSGSSNRAHERKQAGQNACA